MTKRLSVLAVSVAVAGGFLVTSVPAQAATAGHAVARATVTCNESQMRQQIANLKRKAAQLKQLGETAAAGKALSDAAAIQHRLDQCIASERDGSKPFPG
ncbi:hypothetical protein [Streptomyces monashensis]|uniref:Uncharacterized protein n=1 Tax=Streptomyces monashensis TaxID=1678012 RepID=A0A1S2QK49_9ACTN|nr:hypothetical protein [Streptomyces monashensis]OIK06522.1 hypothetical protein BIV23_07530 [Streptomyces monashensis]